MKKQIRDFQVNVEARGSGEAVVFVHGLGGDLNIWHSQVNVCSRSMRTITYDLRGAGKTDVHPPEYSIDLLVEDLKSVLDNESIESAHLVAHSMGTLIVEHFAVRYPEAVKSLTLVGGFTEPPEGARKALGDRSTVVREKGMEAVADAILEGGFSSYTKHSNQAMLGMVRSLLLSNDPEGYAALCRALADARSIKHQEVSVPVLLIVGDEDKTTPLAMSKALYKNFPNAELVVLPNCGHWATLESADEVNRALLKFYHTI
ncbi:alpha/beta fold hydrolase [Ammoniphilus sp. CFH 90114]|uniref:alpha/beta fold hydrolase n=1 Tax=Ammoniphilus sp. CFH 90114 TaxID=2493665 RepID=UPI00100DBE30|nr:alpha/beta hydrolase [Ammoniphilus sp. CFH 90114]RXT02284.1 alpha/beta fold hydrolase [Ammoniphilus sp. CFH 90114]